MGDKMTLQEIIEGYINQCKKNNRELEAIEKLLLHRVKAAMKGTKYNPKNIQLMLKSEGEGTSTSQAQQVIEGIVVDIIQSETRDKAKTAARFKEFLTYLNKYYQVDIHIDEVLPQVFSYEAERQLDLVKMLHEPLTKGELVERYAVSEKTLAKDLNALGCGKFFLGQEIRLEEAEEGEMKYVSSAHPVFMAMNLSEIFTLTIGLIQLGKKTAMESTYNHIAHVVYNQLSPYAKNLIRQRGEELGIYFRENQGYRRYRQEKECKEGSMENALLYAVKSGKRCKISYIASEKIIEKSGHIRWIDFSTYKLLEQPGDQEGVLLDQANILNIEIAYE